MADGGGEVFLIFGGRRPPGLSIDPRFSVLDLPDMADGPADQASVAKRGSLIAAHVSRLRPDRVLVDQLPLGLNAELMDALLGAPEETRLCWGMPYPGVVKPAPRNPRVRQALGRYGDAFVYTSGGFLDPVESYRNYVLPQRVHRLGVVVPEPAAPLPSDLPVVVGLAGAGIGAEAVIGLLLKVAAPMAAGGRLRLRLIAGIYHSGGEALERAREMPGVELLARGGAEEMTRDATVVVGRCGYNSAFSMANTDLPVIFIPWHSPDPASTEQIDRARALSALSGIWWLDERDPEAEARLRHALELGLARGRSPRELPFTTSGAEQAARLLLES